ncbi:hypothetical protein CI109_103631 [Kwoniella shandongensis]|uniref:Uncharacterized protein n=1 Tax=Kwoniella shandongensis TaxID=1734106 RepID=A0A5M6CCF1_9TREE|nr:uncharacterized protein CI109_000677 [Kwoniella shandongensis]KAA5531105.1 hypothetical protein CI109_000677 [Kwoniella shandongensis]
MSQPTSPLLVNSSFSQFDYFASHSNRSSYYSSAASSSSTAGRNQQQSQQAPTFTLSLSDSPTSSSSSSPSSRRSSPSFLPTSQFLTTPERQSSRLDTTSTPSPPTPAPHSSSLGLPSSSVATASASSLGSPKVLSSPRTELRKKAARRSVQIGGDKTTSTVNWARPLRVGPERDLKEEEEGEDFDTTSTLNSDSNNLMRIFGASLQRSRRLNRSPLPSPTSSSPCSEGGPLTPSPIIATPEGPSPSEAPQRGWSVMMSQGKGLGVSGVAAWDTPLTTPSRELDMEFNFEPITLLPSAPSPSSPPAAASFSPNTDTPNRRPVTLTPSPTTSRSSETIDPRVVDVGLAGPTARILSTSQSLNSFSSPSNLEELRILRRAAVDLEAEARRPIRPTDVGSTSQTKDVIGPQRERKIKRKAVPSMIDSDLAALLEPPHPISSPASTSTQSEVQSNNNDTSPPNRRASLVERVVVPRELPGVGGKDIFAQHRQFYQNHMATQSVIEVSPRTKQSSRPFNLTLLTNKQKSNKDKAIPLPIASPISPAVAKQPPFIPPPRITSSPLVSSPTSTTISSTSSSDKQRSSSDGSSSSSSIFMTDPEQDQDQPLTPGGGAGALSASQTELFIVSVENAFKKLEFERAEMKSREMFGASSISASASAVDLTTLGGSGGGKHKRGLSRFLGKDKLI